MSTVQYSLLWKIKHWVFATVTVTWKSGNTSSVDPSAPTILRPGFKWQAQYLRFFQIIFKLCVKKDENLTKKWPFFLKKTVTWIKYSKSLPLYFRLCISLHQINFPHQNYQWLDLNPGPLVSEETDLPTVPLRLPKCKQEYQSECLSWYSNF